MLRLAAAALAGLALVTTLLAGAAAGLAAALTGLGHRGSTPSQAAAADIPANYLALYQAAAATCPGLDWTVLAATWAAVTARHPPPPGGATPPSPYNPHDATYTAAAYLCDNGARNNRDLHAALLTYNRSEDYAADVLTRAARYRATDPSAGGGEPSPAALTAVAF